MADNFGVYDISGKVETVVSSSVERALHPLSGNLNIRRQPERDLYNKILLGKALRSEIGQSQDSLPNLGMTVDGNTVALWRLDEPSSASQGLDEVAGRKLFPFTSGSIFPTTAGQIGYARQVSASSYLQGVGDSTLGTTFSGSGWSIEAWVNPGSSTAGAEVFIYNGLNFSIDPNHLILAQFCWFPTGSIGRLGFTQWQTTSTTTVGYASGTMNSGSWYHVALTRERQTSPANRYIFRIYINGQLDSTHTNIVGQQVSTSGSGHFVGYGNFIGALGLGQGAGNPFVGKLDELRISNRVRTDAEILSSYQRGTGTTPQYAAVPSWTQTPGAKKRHAFVISELSSSQHEVSSRNAYVSGTLPLETTAVPASASLIYSKEGRFRKLTYKLSASANLPEVPTNLRGPSQIENFPRNTWTPTSGSYRNASYFNPAVFSIDVPEYGKIRDVRVWVELLHDHRGGTGPINASSASYAGGSGSTNYDYKHGLQGLQIALRSPNTNFRYSHPHWNDPTTLQFQKRPGAGVSAQYQEVPDLLRNSYLLWAGHAVEQDLGISLGSHTASVPGLWDIDVVATGVFTNQLTYPSMDINYNDRPVYVWNMPFEGRLKISRPFSNAGVVTYAVETVTTSSNIAGTTLRLGSDRKTPYILIGEDADTRLKMARSSSQGWVHSDVSPTTNQIINDFAVDRTGKIVVLTRGNNYFPKLIVSSSDSSGWITTEVGRGGSYSFWHSVECDQSGTFHFTFFDRDEVDGKFYIFYGKTGSAGLSLERAYQPDWTIFSDIQLSIAVNSKNEPYICGAPSTDRDGVFILSSGSNGWASRELFNDIIGGSNTLPRGATFDVDDNLTWLIGMSTYRGVAANDFAVIRSGTNGISLDMLPDRSVLQSFGGYPEFSLKTDSRKRVHVMHDEVFATFGGVFGTIFHYRKTYTSGSESTHYEYDTDIDMRTVFTDSSRVPNPRHLEDVYPKNNPADTGPAGLQIEKIYRTNIYPSPLSAAIGTFAYAFLDPVYYQSAWLTGANFPWMLDARLPPGNFQGRSFSATASLPNGSSPPPGWLTGPGGVANTNEFSTTGSNIGPVDIQPVYPLLDDVFVEKIVSQSPLTSFTSSLASNGKVVGFRPGLRGTEVHGTWKLLIGNNADINGAAVTGSERGGYWFRQFRLEFLIDQNVGVRSMYPSAERRYRKPSHATAHSSKRTIHIISGSSAWDGGTYRVFTSQPDEYGRSIGITESSGNLDFAVFTQLTGTFATVLSSSGRLDGVKSTFLSNEFGTPYIPISSGSGEIPSFEPFTSQDAEDSRTIFQQVINPTTIVPKDNTLRAFLARSNVITTTRDAILKKIKE